ALPAGINYTGGTAITVNAGVISNDLPDKVVSLTPGGATTITGTYPDFTISSTDLVEDADADPSNELQTLSLVGDSLEISNGNKVALPAGINYTGGTAITVNAGVISNDLPDKVVSLTPGGATTITGTYPDFTISSTDNVNDADANPTNEIQALSLNGSLLGITGQPDVNLSGIYSAGSGITLVNSVIENSAQDKIVSLTGSGATSVTGTYPNFTISSTDNVNDSDASASNELISAVDFSGQTLTITEAGIVHSTVISGVGGGGNIIEDSDQDTKIQVEESNDEDIIRFDVEGTEVLVLDRRSAGQTLLNPNPNTNDIYMGRGSGLNSDPDGYNTALGDSALWKNGLGGSSADHGTNNTAVGALAMKQNSTGHDNVAFGSQALQSNQGGVNLTAIGHQALSSNINGHSDVAVGEKALLNNTTGVNNTAIGTLALQSNTTASNNTAVGRSAMENNTTGAHNIAIGRSALGSNTTAFANVAVGTRALFSNKSISKLVAVGDSALYNNGQTVSGSTEGTHNTAVGSKALFENRKGYYNTAVGFEALTVNDNGFHNSAFGRYALFKNTSAQENTAIGSAALFDNTVGDGNTAVGRSTLSNNIGGDNNTAIGFSAFNANGATSYSNSTAIGYNAEPTGSNQVRIGNSTVGSIGGYAAWTNLSDGRFKQHIREDVRGLAFILDLRPVSYQLNMDKLAQALGEELDDEAQENSRQQKASTRQTGFIAQEVEKTAQELGFEFSGIDTPDTPQDHYGLRYAEFVVPLVKAIQEQQQMIEDQQAVNRVQTQQIQSLQLRLEQLEAMISTQD
ncbi:MAG: tail fiber domain-containing protein, partial [Bacteroidota bacterium]